MQINTLLSSYIQNNASTQIQTIGKTNNTETGKQANTTNTKFDVTNMSLNELGQMTKELQESGMISDEEAMMFYIERNGLELFGGISADTKIDMIARFKETIDAMKSTPGSKGVEIVERSLDILQSVQAKSKAEIPAFV